MRRAAAIRPGSSDGRITLSSSLIGLATRHAGANGAACASEMKLHVTASSKPSAAAVRRSAPLDHLRAGRDRPGDAGVALERRRGQLVIAFDPQHFFDQVGGAVDVTPPARRAHAGAAVELEAEREQDRALPLVGHVERAEAERPLRVEGDRRLFDRRRADAQQVGRFAAADVEDQPGQDFDAVFEEGRIDAALEPRPRIAGQRQFLPGPRDPVGREVSDFQHHVAGGVGDARILAAHDPADVVDAAFVGDHRHRWRRATYSFSLSASQPLAVAGAAGDQRAVELGDVVGVARPAEVEHHIIGDVDDAPRSAAARPT